MIFFTDKTMTVIDNGKTEFVDLDTDLGKECLGLYQKGKLSEINDVIAQSKLIGNGVEEGENGKLVVDGVEMDTQLAKKVREFKSQGKPFDFLIKLAEKIEEIDSYFIRHQLYGFLQHNGHPITANGNFIAYKMVDSNFKDLYTGKFDNSVGSTVSMNRRDCNEDPNQSCSAGLHVAAYEYAHNFGSGELVLCEVDPRDVVAVPKDYDQKKMRTCFYKVVGLAEKPIEEAIYEEDDIFEIEASYHDVELGDFILNLENDKEYLVVNDNGFGNFVCEVASEDGRGELYRLDLGTTHFMFI